MSEEADDVIEFLQEVRGGLVSVDCGKNGYFQGKLKNVKSHHSIELDKPLKDGVPLGVAFISLSADKIKDVKVVKYPTKAASSPSTVKGTSAVASAVKPAPSRPATTPSKPKTQLKLQTKPVESKPDAKKAEPKPVVPATSSASAEKKSTKNVRNPISSAGFCIENIPVSVLKSSKALISNTSLLSTTTSNKAAKPEGDSEAAAEAPKKAASVEGTRITVKDLLNLKQQHQEETSPKSGNDENTKALKCNKYGDFRHFTEPQIPAAPAPFRVNFPKRNVCHGPSGIPLLDASNGYSSGRTNNAALHEPIDFKLLNTDFDFDSNLAIFKRSMSEECLTSKDEIKLVKRNFRNDENVLSDPSRVLSWVGAVASTAAENPKIDSLSDSSPDKINEAEHPEAVEDSPKETTVAAEPLSEEEQFLLELRGGLVSVDCGKNGYFQGKLKNVKSHHSIELDKPLKDGVPLGVAFISLSADKIKDVKVVKYPTKAASSPSTVKGTSAVASAVKPAPSRPATTPSKPKTQLKLQTKPVESKPDAKKAEPKPVVPATSSASAEKKSTKNVRNPISSAGFCIENIPVSVLKSSKALISNTSLLSTTTSNKAAKPEGDSEAAAEAPKKAASVEGTRITVKDLLNLKQQQ